MKIIRDILSIMIFTSFNVMAIDQVCDGSTVTAPEEDFTVTDESLAFVLHNKTGLAWARCSIGQTWNEEDLECDGKAVRVTWQEALQFANTYELENRTDWRLPNIKELASIVERSCVTSSINNTIFPSTPSDSFWSSSPNTSATKKTEAWAVAFSNGRLDSRLKQQNYYVRMVRYAEQH